MICLKRVLAAGMAAVMLMGAGATELFGSGIEARAAEMETANNISFDTAMQVTFGADILEELEGADKERYYRFDLEQTSNVNFRYTSNCNIGTGDIYVYDGSRTEIVSQQAYYNSGNYNWVLKGGTYYVKFRANKHHDIKMTSVFTSSTLTESFAESQEDIDDTLAMANQITLGEKYTGVLGINDSIDYYQFTVPASGVVNIYVTNGLGDSGLYCYIYDSSAKSVYSRTHNFGSELLDSVSLAPGTYYFRAERRSEFYSGSYALTLDFAMSAPKISSATNTSPGKMTVSWGEVGGASSYQLRCSKSGYFSSGVKNKTVSGTTLSDSFTGLSTGTWYVQARTVANISGKTTYSAWSDTYNITVVGKVSAPTIKKVKSKESGQMVVSWRKVSDAAGYQVSYSKKKNFKSGVKTVNITNKSTVSLTISGLTKKKTYYVRVRSYVVLNGVKKYSGWSAVKSVKIKK